MAINLLRDPDVPLEQQRFTWHDLVQSSYNKLRDDHSGNARAEVRGD